MLEPEVFFFGSFRLDTGERRLERDGMQVPLPPKAFDLLVALVRRDGRLVRKEELLAEVWADTVVVESNLTQTVWLLRRVLGQEQGGPGYIETVPKAGYRFAGPVVHQAPQEAPQEPAPASGGQSRQRAVGLALLAVVAVCASLLLALARWSTRQAAQTESGTPSVRRAVAALAFGNLSRDSGQAWISAALAELLGAEMAASGELRLVPGDVVARAESELPAGAPEARRREQLATSLAADLLVSGTYLVVGDGAARQMRLDARLFEASSGVVLASCNASAPEAELLRLVAECGARLRRGAGLAPLRGEEERAWLAAQPSDAEARRLYFEGVRALRAYEPFGARTALEAAIAREPGFPLSHAALATVWNSLGYDARAEEEARRAMELSGALPRSARLWVEAAYFFQARRWDEAIRTLQALSTFYPDQVEYGLRLASALSFAGRGAEALAEIDRLRALPEPLGSDPRILIGEAEAADAVGDLERCAAASTAAAEEARRRGARRLLAGALAFRASARDGLGQAEGAWADHRESLTLSEALGDRYGMARELHNMSHTLTRRGDYAEAEAMVRRALALTGETGNRRAASAALGTLAGLARRRGDTAGAIDLYRQGLAVKRQIGDRAGEGVLLHNLGNAHYDLGHLAAAERFYRESLALRRSTGQMTGMANALASLALVQTQRGNPEAAGRSAEESLRLARRTEQPEWIAVALATRAEVARSRGDLARAAADCEEALRVCRQADLSDMAAEVLALRAAVRETAGETEAAARDASEAATAFRRAGRGSAEADARALRVRCLARSGRLAEAGAELDLTRQASAAGTSFSSRLNQDLAAADLAAASGREAEARSLLAGLLARAERAGWQRRAREVRLRLDRLAKRQN